MKNKLEIEINKDNNYSISLIEKKDLFIVVHFINKEFDLKEFYENILKNIDYKNGIEISVQPSTEEIEKMSKEVDSTTGTINEDIKSIIEFIDELNKKIIKK